MLRGEVDCRIIARIACKLLCLLRVMELVRGGSRILRSIVARTTATETGDFIRRPWPYEADPALQSVRRATGANIVVILVDNGEFCGYASQILAAAENAYAAVYYQCATANRSFAHEVGHLQGARHNIEADPTVRPFAFGHGCLDIPNKRRSIMAYDCETGDCLRQPLWAAPPDFGNATHAHDARALNESAPHMSRLKGR